MVRPTSFPKWLTTGLIWRHSGLLSSSISMKSFKKMLLVKMTPFQVKLPTVMHKRMCPILIIALIYAHTTSGWSLQCNYKGQFSIFARQGGGGKENYTLALWLLCIENKHEKGKTFSVYKMLHERSESCVLRWWCLASTWIFQESF